MDLTDFLHDRWYGNPVHDWLVALGVTAVTLLVLLVARRLVVSRVARLAERTQTRVDDVFLEVAARTKIFFLLLVAFWAGTKWLAFPQRVDVFVDHATMLMLLLQGALWGMGLIGALVDRSIERRTATGEAGSVATIRAVGFLGRALLWILIALVALENLGVNITALVAGLGVGGIAVALAVQNILGDLFGALSIVLDKPFVVGDFIIVDTSMGTVEHIGLKTTRLRSLSGEQIVIANSELLKARIRNYKRMYERRIVFTIGVVYDTPPETVARIPGMIRAAIEAQPLTRFDRSHFHLFGDSALMIESVYIMLDAEYNRYMDTQQAINLEILRRFRDEGISIAFPTRTLVFASPPSAPALVAQS